MASVWGPWGSSQRAGCSGEGRGCPWHPSGGPLGARSAVVRSGRSPGYGDARVTVESRASALSRPREGLPSAVPGRCWALGALLGGGKGLGRVGDESETHLGQHPRRPSHPGLSGSRPMNSPRLLRLAPVPMWPCPPAAVGEPLAPKGTEPGGTRGSSSLFDAWW